VLVESARQLDSWHEHARATDFPVDLRVDVFVDRDAVFMSDLQEHLALLYVALALEYCVVVREVIEVLFDLDRQIDDPRS
jgi:hypothetical protein